VSAARASGTPRALRVTQRRSLNGANPRQRATLRSLGLHRIGHTVEVTDTAAARGMVHAVRHLVSVEEPGAPGRAPSEPGGAQ
jgi:large subunit ribosomal protein L30